MVGNNNKTTLCIGRVLSQLANNKLQAISPSMNYFSVYSHPLSQFEVNLAAARENAHFMRLASPIVGKPAWTGRFQSMPFKATFSQNR